MQVFKDANGGEWSVSVNVGTVKRLRAIGCDIMAEDGNGIMSLSSDPVMLGDALWCVCKDQAAAKCITEDSFFSAIGGDSIESATEALIGAVIDFFPSARRNLMKKAMLKSKALQRVAIERAEEKIEKMELQSVMNSEELQE